MSALKCSPFTGRRYGMGEEISDKGYRQSNPNVPWFYNPWTGEARCVADVRGDPYGLLMDEHGTRGVIHLRPAADVRAAS